MMLSTIPTGSPAPAGAQPGWGGPAPDPQPPAARARGRLVQLAALGGALLGAFVGVILDVVGDDESNEFEIPMLAGLIAGFAGGYLVGRGTVAIAAWREPGGHARWGSLSWLLLVTPAYLVAGMVGLTVAALTAGVAPGDLGDALGGSLSTLIVAWLVLGPMAIAFTPSMSGRPKVMHRNLLGCSGTFWVGAFTAMWFVGSFMAVLLVLAAAQSLAPTAYDRAAESPLLMIAMLVAWLVIWVGGSAAVYHGL
jgi:hypothetical protein